MRELLRRLVEPTLGTISMIISWEAWDDILLSMLLALAGGFLGYMGKELARRIFSKKQVNDQD